MKQLPIEHRHWKLCFGFRICCPISSRRQPCKVSIAHEEKGSRTVSTCWAKSKRKGWLQTLNISLLLYSTITNGWIYTKIQKQKSHIFKMECLLDICINWKKISKFSFLLNFQFLLYIPSFLLITVALPHKATELQDLREKDISYNVWSDTFLDFLHTVLILKNCLNYFKAQYSKNVLIKRVTVVL